MSKFSLPVYASCYLSDLNSCLRPTAFLDFAQDAATRAAQEGGFGDEVLRRFDGVWIVARMHTRFLRRVRFTESLRLDTWHKGLRGVNFLRDYRLIGSDGEIAVEATSSWVIMGRTSRSLLRSEEALCCVPEACVCGEDAISEPCPKIVLPKGAEAACLGTHEVGWSDVDYNSHANNVKYSVWALDALPQDFVRSHFLKESIINFNKEIPLGSSVALMHACCGAYHYIEGLVDGHQAFITRLEFE